MSQSPTLQWEFPAFIDQRLRTAKVRFVIVQPREGQLNLACEWLDENGTVIARDAAVNYMTVEALEAATRHLGAPPAALPVPPTTH